MDKVLTDILKNIGLTEKEAKIYLAGVITGTAPVSTIAQEAKINRVTTYDILEKLKQKGLVSFFTKKKIKYFTSLDPSTVLEEFERKTNDLRSALPKLQRLTGKTSHPRVRYFEGLEGIKAIYADTLNSQSEILNFCNSDEIRKIWPNYDEEYVEKRSTKNIFLRGIAPKDSSGIRVHSQDKKYNREIRLLRPELFDFTNEINIYDDKVSIISFKDELIGMIIESQEISNSQRAIFNICWQFAEFADAQESARTKLMQPLKEKELTDSIKLTMESFQTPRKENKERPKAEVEVDNNLSLF